MNLGNIFKKNKKETKKTIPEKEKKAEPIAEASTAKKEFISPVIKVQHTTEKASFLGSFNQYVFKVAGSSNKIEIKKDIEKNYNVKVEAVKILNMPSKLRKLGRTEGIKSGFKKAIIKLQKGHKIDLAQK